MRKACAAAPLFDRSVRQVKEGRSAAWLRRSHFRLSAHHVPPPPKPTLVSIVDTDQHFLPFKPSSSCLQDREVRSRLSRAMRFTFHANRRL